MRINLVPVDLLTDQHLLAETLEVQLVVYHLLNSYKKLGMSNCLPASEPFRLGTGHIIFFKDKCSYLKSRYIDLVNEVKSRFASTGSEQKEYKYYVDWSLLADEMFAKQWQPTAKDILVSIRRIVERIYAKPTWYKYRRKCICVMHDDGQLSINEPMFFNTHLYFRECYRSILKKHRDIL